LKKKELISITFDHNGTTYTALVQKHAPTAVILPCHTILKTICVTHESRLRRSTDVTRVRHISDKHGVLLPLKVLRKPGDIFLPFDPKSAIVYAQEVTPES
jgi:hypothetical protein